MFHSSRYTLAVLALCTLIVAPLHESDARGRRGGFGGGRSFRSSRPIYNPPPSRSADASLSSKVNRSGSSQSRGDAVDARTSTSPATSGGGGSFRTSPDGWRTGGGAASIPQTVRRPDGGYSPVYMDQGRGGHGFFNSAGQWILIGALMNSGNRGGYSPQYAPGTGSAVAEDGSTQSDGSAAQPPRRSGGGGLSFMGLLFLVLLVAGGIYLYVMSRRPRPGGKDGAMQAALGRTTRVDPSAPRTALDPWLELQPGSFITLSDQQAIEDSQKRGGGVQGIDYTVENIGIAQDFDGFATWVLATLYDGHQRLLFMVKGDETHMEHRVYHPSEDFRPARREAVMARGDHWVFEKPASSANFDASKLRYATDIPYSAGGADLHYIRKDHGERHCEYTEKPVVSGFGSLVATIAEYATSDPTDNPELLILEIATSKTKTGEVSLFFGTHVRASEVEIVRSAATI